MMTPELTYPARPRTLGRPTAGGSPRCLFCGVSLADEGLGFIEHIEASDGCRTAHEEWVDRMNEDRQSGG